MVTSDTSGSKGDPARPSTEYHVAKIRSGDRTGFADLYDRIAPSLETWACIRVSGPLRGHVEPGDVVQEVWWRAMDAFDRYDPKQSAFRAWLFRIATNVLLEWNRKRRRRMRIEPSTLAERTASLPPALRQQASSIGGNVAQRDSVRKLVEVVNGLTPEDRAVLVHCGLEGKTIAETAPLVRAEAEAVGKRWQRLREKLAAHPIWREFDPSDS